MMGLPATGGARGGRGAWRRRALGALLLVLPPLLSCTEEGLIKPFIPDAVVVEAPRETLRPGEVMVLAARLTSGEVSITTEKVTWSSSSPAVATVDSSGLVTAVGRGQTVVGASILTKDRRTLRGSAVLTVVGVQSVSIEGVPASLILGASAQLTARLVLDPGAASVPVVWSSSDPTKVTVSVSGLATGVAIGTSTVTATAQGTSATAQVRVVSNVAQIRVAPATSVMVSQQTTQFTAILSDAAGNVLSGQGVTWSSSSQAVATVSATGLVTAVAPGQATITATEATTGRTATAAVTVVPRVGSGAISPSNPSFFQGQTVQLSVSLLDPAGTLLPGRPVIWQSSAPDIATVGRGSGLVTGVAAGTATIVAIDSLSGFAANTSVTVVIPVATLLVSPPASTLAIGGSQQLIASAFDAAGGPLTGRPVSWSSSNNAVATVSSLGLVTAVSPGSATITASVEGRTATAAITVSPPPVASVQLAPPSASIVVGATQQFTASAFDAAGELLTGRAVSWSSTNAAVATVSAAGLVTGVATGTATVVATVEGRTASATVTVSAPPVATVTVTPATATLVIGSTLQFSAVMRDAGNTVLPGRDVAWSTSAPTVATVSASGLVTAVAVGTATLTATSEGRTGTATLTITNPPVASVTIDPPSVSMLPGDQVTFTARPVDGSGNLLAGRTITWSVGNTSVATVSTAGRVTAVTPGNTTVTATVEGRSATAALTVNAPVASVTVTPAALSLVVGAAQQLSATSRDADGNQLQRRPVSWTSSAPNVATISNQGLVAGLTPGVAVITASVEGRTASSQVTVTLAPVATITLDPTGGYLPIGVPVPIVATLRDPGGNVLSDRTIAWSSSDVSRGTVSSAGVVSALNASPFTVSVSSEGRTASAAFEGRPALRSGIEQVVSNGSVGTWLYYAIYVPAGSASLTVSITGGTGDPDLYVWRPGNTGTANCFPELDGPQERCEFSGANAPSGVWLVGVRAYAAHAQTRLQGVIRP